MFVFTVQDEFQILVNGIALGLTEPKKIHFRRKMQMSAKPMSDDELIFNLEEEHVTDLSNSQTSSTQAVSSSSHVRNQYLKETGSLKLKSRSPSRPLFRSLRLDKQVLTVPTIAKRVISLHFTHFVHSHRTLDSYEICVFSFLFLFFIQIIFLLRFFFAIANGIYLLQASLRERYGVDITPLTYIPSGRIDKYLGNLNFFFIRESTSIRENGGISGFVHYFITEVRMSTF